MFIKIEDKRVNFDKVECYKYDRTSDKTFLFFSKDLDRDNYSFEGNLTQALDLALQTKELKNV